MAGEKNLVTVDSKCLSKQNNNIYHMQQRRSHVEIKLFLCVRFISSFSTCKWENMLFSFEERYCIYTSFLRSFSAEMMSLSNQIGPLTEFTTYNSPLFAINGVFINEGDNTLVYSRCWFLLSSDSPTALCNVGRMNYSIF